MNFSNISIATGMVYHKVGGQLSYVLNQLTSHQLTGLSIHKADALNCGKCGTFKCLYNGSSGCALRVVA